MARRFLLLADQPFQLRFQIRLAEMLRREGHHCEIAVVDTYVFMYAPHLLHQVRESTGFFAHTLETLYQSWQTRGEPDLTGVEDFLQFWEKNHCSMRTMEQLASTNNTLYADERSDYMLRVSAGWEQRILADTISWVDGVLESTRPDVIFSIDHCTLPTNVFFEKSLSEGIPFMTLQNTRIGNRWVIRDDFFLGMSEQIQSQALLSLLNTSNKEFAEKYVQDYREQSSSTYYALAHSRSMLSPHPQWAGKLGFHLKKVAKHFADGVFRLFYRRPVRFQVRRLEQNFVKLSLWEIRGALRLLSYDLGLKYDWEPVPPETDYFFWALHFRPEGSVLVLGKGLDEIDVLTRVAERIPKGTVLVVKEHPLMFGYRRRGFYEQLKSFPNVRLVDPFSDSKSLIRESLGVLGISGTVLLEARLLGLPAWSFGDPEFKPVLSGTGWEGLQEFMEQVVSRERVESDHHLLAYLSFVFEHSSESDSAINELLRPFEQAHLEGDLSRVMTILQGQPS